MFEKESERRSNGNLEFEAKNIAVSVDGGEVDTQRQGGQLL